MIYKIVWADVKDDCEMYIGKDSFHNRYKDLMHVRRFGMLSEYADCVPSTQTPSGEIDNEAVWVGVRPIFYTGSYRLCGVVLEYGENFVHKQEDEIEYRRR